MKIINPINSVDVLFNCVKADKKSQIDHLSIGQIIENLNVLNQRIFSDFPKDLKWHSVQIEEQDLEQILISTAVDTVVTLSELYKTYQESGPSFEGFELVSDQVDRLNRDDLSVQTCLLLAIRKDGPYVLIASEYSVLALLSTNKFIGQTIYLGLSAYLQKYQIMLDQYNYYHCAVPRDLVFVSAQPDEPFFHWQTEIYLYNFEKQGIPREQCFALFAVKGEPSDYLRQLHDEHPGILWYQDDRPGDIKYISSVRPNILKKFFKEYPEKGKYVFYHDSDITFTYLPPFKQLVSDDIAYLSDTIGYIGYEYIKASCGRYKEKYPQLSDTDLLDKMASCANISPELIKQNELNSGGAQYLFKGVDYNFWDQVEQDSINLYHLMVDYDNQYPVSKGIQKWTADMWAVLWGIWKSGKESRVVDELSFSWAIRKADDSKDGYFSHNIFHLAGVTGDFVKEHPDYFYKGRYRKDNLIELLRKDMHCLDYVNPNNASGQYVAIAIEYVSQKFDIPYYPDQHLRELQNKELILIKNIICNKINFTSDNHELNGIYDRTFEEVCGKNIWQCDSKNKIMFHNKNNWIITDIQYRSELNENSGGLLFSSDSTGEPYESQWKSEHTKVQAVTNAFEFEYNTLSDTYVKTDALFNKQPIWQGKSISKIMFYNGQHWVITDKRYQPELTNDSGGYLASTNTDKAPYEAFWYG